MPTFSDSRVPGIHIAVVTSLPNPIPCRSTLPSELLAWAARPGIPKLPRPAGSQPISYLAGSAGPLYIFLAHGKQISGTPAPRSEPEWQYVNVKRLTIYIESSLQAGLQWAVFENNGPALWQRVVNTVGGFMQNLFVQGAFQGSSPSDAYFVQCGPTTMTQADIAAGRLTALVGFAPQYPAEFVVLQISVQTNSKTPRR